MSPADLDGVATFYNLIFRKPVGRHVVMLCNSVSCWIMGYERIREHVTRQLGIEFGETTPDNRFTLLAHRVSWSMSTCAGDVGRQRTSRQPRCGKD